MLETIKNELNTHKQTFYVAWVNTSFSPEKRAESVLNEFSEELTEDLQTLGDNQGNYKEKYISFLTSWLSAKSLCMSAFITGPANFPVARNKKNQCYEVSAWDKFRTWREKYFKAVNRVRTPSPEEDLDSALLELDKCLEYQESMKLANKILRSKKTTETEKKEELGGLFSSDMIEKIYKPDYVGNIGFKRFELTNNNAKIKRLKEKVLTMKSRIETKKEFEPIIFKGGSITIEADRVIIKHEEKPDRETINNIKKHGFRWSRKFSCWCRKQTAKALYDAKIICGLDAKLQRESADLEKEAAKKVKQDKINNFPYIFFAFSNAQFEEGMQKLGLTTDKEDLKKIVSIVGGGYILKSKREEWEAIFK